MSFSKGYALSEEFCQSMLQIKNISGAFADARLYPEGRRFLAVDRLTKRYMNSSKRAIFVSGVVTFLLMHPVQMKRAQEFYRNDFGKPCDLI